MVTRPDSANTKAPVKSPQQKAEDEKYWKILDDIKFKGKNTTGEKLFNGIAYGFFAGVATFVASVLFTWLAKDSSVKFFHKDYTWKEAWEGAVDRISNAPLINKLKDPRSFAGDILMTTSLMMGGNVFLFPIRWMEGSKKEIVHFFNKHFGKEGEVERGDKRVTNEPPQKWGSLIKGRLVAWSVVFASLRTVKWKTPHILGAMEEGGNKLFTSTATAVKPNMSQERQEFYGKLGEYSGVDFFATVAASSLLFVTSKIFAKKGKPENESVPSPDERPLTADEFKRDYKTIATYKKPETTETKSNDRAEEKSRPSNLTEKTRKRESRYVDERRHEKTSTTEHSTAPLAV